MPLTPALAESNRAQTRRLRALVERLTPAQYGVRLSNGWTVAGILGHIAMWDRQRMCMLQRIAAGLPCHGAYDGEVFNAATQPILELIPGERVAAAAVRAAEEIDALLLELPDEVIARALAIPNPPNLDRGGHRADHLDQIERAIK